MSADQQSGAIRSGMLIRPSRSSSTATGCTAPTYARESGRTRPNSEGNIFRAGVRWTSHAMPTCCWNLQIMISYEKTLFAIVTVASLVGCTTAREMSPQEAWVYCKTHPVGTTFGMNPFGEEYSTWVSYCGDEWRGTSAGFAYGAEYWQRQQEIDAGPRTSITTCTQSSMGSTCVTN